MTNTMPRDSFSLLKILVERYRTRQQMPDFMGKPLLDLSIGNPDLAPSTHWRSRLQYFIGRDDLHGYGDFRSDITLHLYERFVAYYQRRFLPHDAPVLLDPERHVVDLLGSKEGIFYSLLSCLNPGEAVLMPDPSYTVYQSSARLIGARVELFSCDQSGQPELASIRPEQLQGARMLVICSPGNPTGVELSPEKLKEVLDFAEQHDLWVVIDRAYAEITFKSPCNGVLSGAALPLPGALSRVVELHSLSKSCSLAGWRIGFAVGSAELIDEIRNIKFNTDFGAFLPLKCVAAEILDELETIAECNSTIYAARMRRFANGAASLGWNIPLSQGTFFLWAPLPPDFADGDDLRFVEYLLDKTGILVAPGSGFGPGGAGRVRIALVQSDDVLDEALHRLKKWRALSSRSVV
ncbi:pyridoxal phosphate-dependent aminotransferase (plasmid) [Yersinia sp. HM-2024]|uniref:pyridoxal phosphate-dependent aminotransferase n=1 Tax=Yersinia sp. HM-2024 TaxID=3344550 RepID=UPI00370D263E